MGFELWAFLGFALDLILDAIEWSKSRLRKDTDKNKK